MNQNTQGPWGEIESLLLNQDVPLTAEEKQNEVDERHEMDLKFARTFSTPDGAAVLNYLFEENVYCVGFNPTLDNPQYQGFFNDGARNMCLKINQRIRRAEERPEVIEDELEL